MESSVSALRLMASTDAPSLPPTTKPLSFSICKILGLEDTVETVKHFSNSVKLKQIYQYIECPIIVEG